MISLFTIELTPVYNTIFSRPPPHLKTPLLQTYRLGHDARDCLTEVVSWLPSSMTRGVLLRWTGLSRQGISPD